MAGALASTFAVQAQDAEAPGYDLTLRLTTGLNFSDNPDRVANPTNSASYVDTKAVLGFSSETRTQVLRASIGAEFEAGEGATNGDGVKKPFASLQYGLEGANAALALGFSYRERDNGFSTLFDAETDTDQVIDQGTRRDASGNVSLSFGSGGPVSETLSIGYSQRRFADTTDPDLVDQDRTTASSETLLTLNPTTQIAINLNYARAEEFDAANRVQESRGISVGLQGAANAALTYSALVGYSEVEVTDSGVTSTNTGPTLQIQAAQQLRNGELTGVLTRKIESNGAHTSLAFGRNMELARGSLSFSLGLARGQGETAAIGKLEYAHDMPLGRLTANLSRQLSANSDDEDEVRSRAALRLVREVSSISAIQFEIDYAMTEIPSGTSADRTQTGAGINYTRELGQDWALKAGYRYSQSHTEGSQPIHENKVFATVSREFSLRP